MTDEQIRDAYLEHGSQQRAADALGITRKALRCALARLKRKTDHTWEPHSDPENVPYGQRVKATTTQRRILDPETGERIIQWQKTERDPHAVDVPGLIEALSSIEGLARALPAPAEHASADLLNCLPIGDPHFGMYAWGAETGQRDFDLKIAERQWRTMIDNAVAVMPHTEQGVMIQLGDLTHGNDHKNVTPQSGHHLDVDTRHALVMMAAHRCMVYAAERMRERCRSLRIVSIGGNHSPDAVIALNIALDAYFRHVPEVEVDMSVRDIRHVISFGDVLITASHGDKQKPEALGALVPAHYPAEWGSSVHRYHHGGHVHHTHRRDIGGLVFESHRSPAPMDAYAAAKFWSQQSVSAIVYHRRLGERRRFTIGIE